MPAHTQLHRLHPLLIVIIILALMFLFWSTAGCPDAPQSSYQRRLMDTGRPALHAVHKDRLREIMADLSRLTFERLPQEMDTRAYRERDVRELVAVADALAADARAIPDVLHDVRISPEDRRVFNSFADKLYVEATDLAALARDRRLDQVRSKMDEMISTCNACHSSFRILPRVTASN